MGRGDRQEMVRALNAPLQDKTITALNQRETLMKLARRFFQKQREAIDTVPKPLDSSPTFLRSHGHDLSEVFAMLSRTYT